MTRSELLAEAIKYHNSFVDMYEKSGEQDDSYGYPYMKLIQTVLLAEQKRSEGCDKCNDPKILEIQIETGFDYCPHCGRDLTEGESV